jgi:Asp-tRNA(Asn)/Glu-tRNA(Gln) amidotransferase A subunit family amidase
VLALPIGFSSGRLPLGAQLIGGALSERLLLSAGEAFQAGTDWHTRLPPLRA